MKILDQALSRSETLLTLRIAGPTLDGRLFHGEMSLAFGCEMPPYTNAFLPIDLFALLMSSMLAAELGGKPASMLLSAAIVRDPDTWPLWLRMLQKVEDDPHFHERARPADEQLFLSVGLRPNAPPKVATGTIAQCLMQLGNDVVQIRALPIAGVLRQLHVNARKAKVTLPPRLTVSRSDPPGHAEWKREIAEYQQLAAERLKVKNRSGKRVKRGSNRRLEHAAE